MYNPMNFEMHLRQTINEWCTIQKLLQDKAVIQSWLDALITRDRVYSEIGQSILKHHYCNCSKQTGQILNTKPASFQNIKLGEGVDAILNLNVPNKSGINKFSAADVFKKKPDDSNDKKFI